MELIRQAQTELVPSAEKPKNTILFTLPEISVGGSAIRLAMHSDTTLGLLRALRNLPELDSVWIEGRCLDSGRQSRLMEDSVYRFFMDGRILRAQATSETDYLAFVLPLDINIEDSEVRRLVSMGFSPRSLAERIGYQVGYYSARDLVSYYDTHGELGKLLGIIGGGNEFLIGSDTLSRATLKDIAEQIHSQLSEEQISMLLNLMSSAALKISSIVPLTQPFSKDKKLDFYNVKYNISEENITKKWELNSVKAEKKEIFYLFPIHEFDRKKELFPS